MDGRKALWIRQCHRDDTVTAQSRRWPFRPGISRDLPTTTGIRSALAVVIPDELRTASLTCTDAADRADDLRE
jgi:hypothetical protein